LTDGDASSTLLGGGLLKFYLTCSHGPIFVCFVCLRHSPVEAKYPQLHSKVQQKFSNFRVFCPAHIEPVSSRDRIQIYLRWCAVQCRIPGKSAEEISGGWHSLPGSVREAGAQLDLRLEYSFKSSHLLVCTSKRRVCRNQDQEAAFCGSAGRHVPGCLQAF
jgi:hypothetical protein